MNAARPLARELTQDEILASIRRIMKEDGPGPAPEECADRPARRMTLDEVRAEMGLPPTEPPTADDDGPDCCGCYHEGRSDGRREGQFAAWLWGASLALAFVSGLMMRGLL